MSRGGYRPGGGRPRGSKTTKVEQDAREAGSPLDYLLSIVNDADAEPARRDRAAIAALPYCHPRAEAPPGGKRTREPFAPASGDAGADWGDRLGLTDLYQPRRVRPFGG